MALVKFIAATKSQTSGGLWGTIHYCCREEKTAYQGRHLVTGVNCVAETAYQEFMNTKRLHNKNDGRMFYHMIQSFKPEENLTPQTAHEIALKMANQLPGFEILVATHTDREHIHSHFIINSVSVDSGKKYHSNLESLQQLREISDQICTAYGLSVIQPKHRKTPAMSAREYRSADKGQSWKLQLAITIEDAMTMARSCDHFISLMELEGYQVRWSKEQKYITYTDPQGNKCRDIRLHEEKYRKENMEREFRIRSQILGRNESQTARYAAAGGESTSLRRRDRTQLGSDDCFPKSPDRGTGRDAKHAFNSDDQSRTDRSSEPATNNSDGEWQQNLRNDGAVPGADDGCGEDANPADGGGSHRDADTGWEDQRAVFTAALSDHAAAETLYQEAVLDFSDPQFAPADFGMDAAHLAANLSGLIEDDRPVEDCTTKHYQPERKNHHGHTMGGM